MRKVLIIAYHFPPDAAVGGIRPAKFAKYISDFGWEPFILTVREKYYEQLDGSKLQEIENKTAISRTSKLPNIRDVYMSLKFMLAKIKRAEKQLAENILKDTSIKEKSHVPKGIKATILRLISSIFIWLPDDKLGWVPIGILKGMHIIRKEKIDVILTTSPPHSVQLIGLILKLMTRIKWIADFRDPWMINFTKPLFVRTGLSDRIETRMERKIIESADRIILTTPLLEEKFSEQYTLKESNKFITIWNGFDSEDINGIRGVEKHSKFTITYAGTFYLNRTPKLLLNAISDLLKGEKIEARKFSAQFIGNTKYADNESIEEMVGYFNLSHIVQIKEWMPHRDVLRELAKSHVLLLLASRQPYQIPAKVFDYIGLDSNIIAIIDDGATSDLLKNYKKAFLVREDSIESLKEAILYFYNTSLNPPEEGLIGTHNSFSNKYNRRFLTKQLVEVLNDLISA